MNTRVKELKIAYLCHVPPANIGVSSRFRCTSRGIWYCSICLGLFALVCWDALFASLVPVLGRFSGPSVSNASTGVGPITTRRSRGHEPRSQDPQDADTAVGCDGDADGRSMATGDAESPVTRHNQHLCSSRPEGEGDVFHPFPSPFQSEPADLMTPAFAGRRRHLLEDLFACVERGGAVDLLRRTWSRHHGKACTGEASRSMPLRAC